MNSFAKLCDHNNPIHSEVHESKLNVLVAKVLQCGPVTVSAGIVHTGHYQVTGYLHSAHFLGTPSRSYFTSFTRVHQFSEYSPKSDIVTPSLCIVQEHSRYKVSVGLEHSRARTEAHVHVARPHLTPHHHCLLRGAAHALQ